MISRRAACCSAAAAVLGTSAQHRDANMFANAEAYERFMGRWSRLVAPLLVDFAEAPDGGRVLDAGSGSGSLAFTLARLRPKTAVVGIDPSKEYIAYAESRNAHRGRVSFETGDAQKLPFAGATFRMSLALLVFNFIPDPALALRELRRVTQAGGRVCAAVWDYGGTMGMLRAFWDGAAQADSRAERLDEKHMPLCRRGDLGRLWTQGGLADVHEAPLEIAMKFQSFADYWDPFLLGQGPAGSYVQALPKDRLPALREGVKRRLALADEDRAFTLPARVWAVRGTVPAAP